MRRAQTALQGLLPDGVVVNSSMERVLFCASL